MSEQACVKFMRDCLGVLVWTVHCVCMLPLILQALLVHPCAWLIVQTVTVCTIELACTS